MKKYSFVLALFSILGFIVTCAPVQKESVPFSTPESQIEAGQNSQKPAAETQQGTSSDVREILDKSEARVKGIYYKYKGPETGNDFYEFYIKGSRIKYKPHLEIKTLDKPESFDSIFIDTSAKTAASYCEAVYCTYKGKKQDLNYGQAYILTIFDWIGVEQAEKVGEEVIDSRSTWKLETNLGTLWIDTFYGIPLKAESNGKTYRFEQIAVNSMQDSDVVPSS